jgi:hypothetical protein
LNREIVLQEFQDAVSEYFVARFILLIANAVGRKIVLILNAVEKKDMSVIRTLGEHVFRLLGNEKWPLPKAVSGASEGLEDVSDSVNIFILKIIDEFDRIRSIASILPCSKQHPCIL